VKFLAITLIVHAPDSVSGVQKWPSPSPAPLLTGSPA